MSGIAKGCAIRRRAEGDGGSFRRARRTNFGNWALVAATPLGGASRNIVFCKVRVMIAGYSSRRIMGHGTMQQFAHISAQDWMSVAVAIGTIGIVFAWLAKQ